MIHVAIILPVYSNAIVSGRKTVEARLTRNRIVPYGAVKIGDRIYFKESSGPFVLTAVAAEVEQLEGLTPRHVSALRRRYNERVLGSREYWQSKGLARYATFVTLSDVQRVTFGPDFKSDPAWRPRSAWMTLDENACVFPECLAPRSPTNFVQPINRR